MARHVVVQVLCDVCESAEGATPIEFSVDRSSFEIDLCDKHRSEFSAAIGTFVAHARSAKGRATRLTGTASSPSRPGPRRESGEADAIRTWARANGFAVSDRGRIPGHVQTAWEARTGS